MVYFNIQGQSYFTLPLSSMFSISTKYDCRHSPDIYAQKFFWRIKIIMDIPLALATEGILLIAGLFVYYIQHFQQKLLGKYGLIISPVLINAIALVISYWSCA